MKFVFSLCLLLLGGGAMARPVILLTYHLQEKRAQSLRWVLEQEMNIPSILISLERRQYPCQKNTRAVAHICIENGGQVKAPWMRYDIIERNIKPFYRESSGSR